MLRRTPVSSLRLLDLKGRQKAVRIRSRVATFKEGPFEITN